MQRTKKTGRKNIKTRQQIKKGISKRCCCRQSTWLIIAPLSHHYCSAIAPLLLRCISAVAPLSHTYRYTVAPLSLRCCTAIAPLLLCCCSAAVALLSRRCCTTIAPISLHCRTAAVTPAVATQSHRYCTAIAPLSLRCHCCRSCCCNGITAAIAPAVTYGCRLKKQNLGNSFHW